MPAVSAIDIGNTPQMNEHTRVEACAVRLANEFGLGGLDDVEPITLFLPAFRNQTYRILTKEGVFVLRHHFALKREPNITWEHTVSEYARMAGIRIPAVLGTYCYEGELFSAYEYVDGRALVNAPITPTIAEQAGEILGCIHRCLASFHPADSPTQSFDDRLILTLMPNADLSTVIDEANIPEQARWKLVNFLQARQHLFAYRKRPPTGQLAPQIIHGDFHSGNLLVSGTHMTTLDWESSFFGDLSFDIAKSLLFLCGFAEEIGDYRCTQAFLRAYSAHVPLTRTDLTRILWQLRFAVAACTSEVVLCALYGQVHLLPLIERNGERMRRMIVLEEQAMFDDELPGLLWDLMRSER